MTYSIGGKIQAADFNEIINGGTLIPIPVGVNHIWNDGTVIGGTTPGRQYGYGQSPALSTVSAGDKITAGPSGTPTEWQKMFNTMNTIAAHQGTTLTWSARHPTFPPVTGTRITWETNLVSSIASLASNRFNTVRQGIPTPYPVTNTIGTWINNLRIRHSVQFTSDSAARYFFNAGGQLKVYASHPVGTGTSINQFINDLCADLETVVISAPTGLTTMTVDPQGLLGTPAIYRGVTQVTTQSSGTYPAGLVSIAPTLGFYGQTIARQSLIKQRTNYLPSSHYGSAYGPNSFIEVLSSYDDSTGLLIVDVIIDEMPNGAVVSTGTTTTLIVTPPYDSSTGLPNTPWGTPTVTSSVTLDSPSP